MVPLLGAGHQHTSITMKSTVYIAASVHIVHKDKNGKVLYESPPEKTKPKHIEPSPPAAVKMEYRFADWAGSEDLITLTRKYLDELQQVVKDGIDKSFLTG